MSRSGFFWVFFLMLLLTLAAFVMIACTDSGQNPKEVRSWTLERNWDHPEYLEIANLSNKPVRFELDLNGRFFWTRAKIKQQYKDSLPENPARFGFELVSRHLGHGVSYFADPISYFPEVYLNSQAFAECGEQVQTLAEIYDLMGVEHRIWRLGGHVVVEAMHEGKWQLYDPHKDSWFLNSLGEPASLEEVIAQPDRLTERGDHEVPSQFLTVLTRHLSRIRKSYATQEDNELDTFIVYPRQDLYAEFQLPPKAVARFAHYFTFESLTYEPAMLEVTLTGDGDLYIPLLIHRTSGNATIEVETPDGVLPISKAQSYLSELPGKLKITGVEDTLVVCYKLNYFLELFDSTNVLTLTGEGLDRLEVKFREGFDGMGTNDFMDTKSAIYKTFPPSVDKKYQVFKKHFTPPDSFRPDQLEAWGLEGYLKLTAHHFPKGERAGRVEREMRNFISQLADKELDKMLTGLLQSDPAIIYFVYFGLESYGANQLADIFYAFSLYAD